MDYDFAKEKADELLAKLAPLCVRIEIAGSIRRLKPYDIHDIELVCISQPPAAVFGQSASDKPRLQALLDKMREAGELDHRRDKNGRPAWGDKFRRALWGEIPVDIFITDPQRWGMIYTIRTGGAAFSHALVTKREYGGLLPNRLYVENGLLWNGETEEIIPTPEERDVFRAIGIDWLEPSARDESAIGLIREGWGLAEYAGTHYA